MKLRTVFSKLLMSAIVLAVLAYMATYIYQAVKSPFKTTEAVLYTIEDVVPINGTFFRDELAVEKNGAGLYEYLISEGEKVSKDEVLALQYENTSAMEIRKQLEEVSEKLDLLEHAASPGGVSELSKIDQTITDALVNLSYGIERIKTTEVAEASRALKAGILKRGLGFSDTGVQQANAEIQVLAQERKTLERGKNLGTIALQAPISGYFSRAVDGYEGILTIERTKTLTLDELNQMDRERSPVGEDMYCGRLMSGFEWRFAAAVPQTAAALLREGAHILLRFVGDYVGELDVRVLRVDKPEQGQSLVLFSSSTMVAELLGLRKQMAELVISTYEGIRIPKEALRINEEGRTGVYCVVAMQAKFFLVEQIYETDQHYVVRYNPTDRNALRPGDEVIVSSKNLYDGKIIQ